MQKEVFRKNRKTSLNPVTKQYNTEVKHPSPRYYITSGMKVIE
jgi:hypothetical protein